MTQRWRRNRAGSQSGSWKDACTIKSVRKPLDPVCGNTHFKSLPTDYLTPVFPRPAVKYERIKFLVIALKSSVEIYAWAPKPYHKFMAFKVRRAPLLPT